MSNLFYVFSTFYDYLFMTLLKWFNIVVMITGCDTTEALNQEWTIISGNRELEELIGIRRR